MSELKQGQALEGIFWSEGGELSTRQKIVDSITVTMEYGQMVGVPWAKATYTDGKVVLYNLALCEGVTITPSKLERKDGSGG